MQLAQIEVTLVPKQFQRSRGKTIASETGRSGLLSPSCQHLVFNFVFFGQVASAGERNFVGRLHTFRLTEGPLLVIVSLITHLLTNNYRDIEFGEVQRNGGKINLIKSCPT